MSPRPARAGRHLRALQSAVGYRNPMAGRALGAFGVMATAQIAVTATSDATIEWLFTLMVVAFAVTSLLLAAGHWGVASSALAAAYVVIVMLAVENVGSGTGIPFGEYHYTGALEPTMGGVPLIVPLAWLAMAFPALEVGRRISGSPVGGIAVGAVALTAWDLFLGPRMADNGYRQWTAGGAYHGIPLSNYLGWLVVGFLVLGTLDRIRPRQLEPDTGLIAVYTWWALIETVAFVVFLDEPFVGLVGGVAMGAVAVLAWYRWTLGTADPRIAGAG